MATETLLTPTGGDPALAQAEASTLLGMASGLAATCCGAAEGLRGIEAQDVTGIILSLRHITTLIDEAEGLMSTCSVGAEESVVTAKAVCRMVADDIGVESEGRFQQHWSDDITAWSLHALCDVIERAKDAVDRPNQAVAEVAHG